MTWFRPALVIALSSAIAACATAPPPRPAALDPANPAGQEGSIPVMTALDEERPAGPVVAGPEPTTAPELPDHDHGAVATEEPPPPPRPALKPASAGPKTTTKPRAGGKPATAVYTCPMHPEVESAKPDDRCPKCGMKLVPKAAPKGHQH
jgi:hypothetical protein